ncbi:MAG: M48 family metalloprotease [Phaeospirillum sp.]|nr:M48 family metalloprotease [Phaeospirillum sp.]
MRPLLDQANLETQARRNRRDSIVILAGIVGLTALAGWLVAGGLGVAGSVVAAGVGMLIHPHASAVMLRRLWRAVPLPPHMAPDLWAIVTELSRRAGLESVPPLYFIPRPEILALSTGWGRHAAIGISDGLLLTLPPPEVAAVLAHEIGHIRAGDLKILRLAEAAGRLTHTVALAGLILLLLYLPGILELGMAPPPWPFLVIMAAPLVSDLLTLKLARTREFAADASAAELTGNPRALMAALARLHHGWENPRLSLIRTHPTTEERLTRLADLAPPVQWIPLSLPPGVLIRYAPDPMTRRRFF